MPKVGITDTILRDGHQSQAATRMKFSQMEPMLEKLDKVEFQEGIPEWDFEGTAEAEEMVLVMQDRKELRSIMSNYVGIVRSNLRLERALKRLAVIWQETEELYNRTKPCRELCELRNMIAVAYLVIKQGRDRKESVGCHYNVDYPQA